MTLNDILNKYITFTLNPYPSKTWKCIRFVLHWLTLPLKLVGIGALGGYQIVVKSLTTKYRAVPKLPSLATKKAYFKKIFDRLPVLDTQELLCYVNRVPYYSVPDGTNHNYDHQCSRHGTYSFLMAKLGIQDSRIDKGTWNHMQAHWLCRGYKWNAYEGTIQFNAATTSGDMLCGLNMAMLLTDNSITKERYDHLVTGILENDYSLLEGASPESTDPGYDLYQTLLKQAGGASDLVKMKSQRGMWQPGLETVGAQALTILATLRMADKRLGSKEAKSAYKKLLWQYGYGLLSLFPTAYIDSKRGYFNDHNCIISLYVLSKLSDNRLGRLFWKIPMVYVWLLSRHWFNGYFTGLLNDAYPGFVTQKYLDTCKAYLYEDEPRNFGFGDTATQISDEVPVRFNMLYEDEFSPDLPQNQKIVVSSSDALTKTGLGFMAAAIMLETDPKSLR